MASGSPLRICSAPTFFPFVLHPYLGLNNPLNIPQDDNNRVRLKTIVRILRLFIVAVFNLANEANLI